MNFTYTSEGTCIFYNGCQLDSLLELKYILSIEHTHAWIRDGLEMYYGLHGLANGVKGHVHCYRPDFLVRDWKTGNSKLVEIKPYGFNHDQTKRQKIAEKYIKRFGYDWSFEIVNEAEIKLTDDQWQHFLTIQSQQKDWRHKPCMKLLQNTSPFSDAAYDQFVRTGVLPAFVP
ncbi:MAG: hypothetical protein V4557_12530 [Bacteroidota bacterium]